MGKFKDMEKELEDKVMAPVKKAVEVVEKVVQDELLEFDAWYAQREELIPVHHYKEILKADFQARKMAAMSTMAQWDEALKKYGIKLD